MAGTDPRFDSAKFTSAIAFAQSMGLAPDEAEQPVFYPADTRTPDATVGQVWDPRTLAAEHIEGDPPTGIRAICGIKVLSTTADETALGRFVPVELELTFMPDEWAKVSDFAEMRMGELRFQRGETLPTTGLFDVAIHTVRVRAPDAA